MERASYVGDADRWRDTYVNFGNAPFSKKISIGRGVRRHLLKESQALVHATIDG
jgi:hypothetical protein